MIINGIERLESDTFDSTFYSTFRMLSRNFLFEAELYRDSASLNNTLVLYHFDDDTNEAHIITLIHENHLVNEFFILQTIKQVHDIFSEDPFGTIEDFLDIMKELSLGYRSTSMQNNEEDKAHLFMHVKERFKDLELIRIENAKAIAEELAGKDK